jgi:hypothetical protein
MAEALRRDLTLPLLLGTTAVVEGIRAGAGTFRLLLDLPARFSIGPVAFADFSRATDLSTTGVVFYVLYGVGGLIVTAVAWFATWRLAAARSVRTLAGVACACSIGVLLLTIPAAPLMWRVGATPNDPAALAVLLDRFTFWTTLRVAAVDASFLSVIGAMIVLMSHEAPAQPAG